MDFGKANASLLRFGAFELDLGTSELRKDGSLTKLAPQPSKVLALLAGRAGELVSREEIQRGIWCETTVDFEQGLNFAIKKIRAALGDQAGVARYVETVTHDDRLAQEADRILMIEDGWVHEVDKYERRRKLLSSLKEA
jgi:DNA-binding winged helix-turn-helix (wHTH) protein